MDGALALTCKVVNVCKMKWYMCDKLWCEYTFVFPLAETPQKSARTPKSACNFRATIIIPLPTPPQVPPPLLFPSSALT